ncbi:MAG: RlmE family RNA methyltransferase, partial [Alphaproteobacteria bacterium]|nr:RlmE family RNA methyltransferase [Alphaproteobacteria bacterium]
MPKKRNTGGNDRLHVRVKTAAKRTTSSTRWLQRQLNDPYVAAAKRDGYASRAAYKLLEIDDKFHLLNGRSHIVDLGAAPGGWSQVAAARCGKGGRVLAIDILEMPIPDANVDFMQLDFLDEGAPAIIAAHLDSKIDVVLSDMAAAATGHRQTDHIRTIALAEAAAYFACDTLVMGGSFCAKVFQGGSSKDLLMLLKDRFAS